MKEIWKEIKGFEGEYEVSNLGRIRSMDRMINGRFYKSKIRSIKITPNVYPKICLCSINGDRTARIHRLVAENFIPNPDNKKEVNHIDGDKTNNRVDNLEWVTPTENKIHNHRLGITRRGERHQNSILTEEQAIQVKKLIKLGYSQSEIVKKTGLRNSMINNIKRNNTWTYLSINDNLEVIYKDFD